MATQKVYQAEKNNSHYWFVSQSKKDIIELYGFLSNKDIAERSDVEPDGFFRYIFKNEDGNLEECRYDEREEVLS